MRGHRLIVTSLVVVAVALAAALSLRHGLVEPPHWQHLCDPAPWQSRCAPRTLLLRAFAGQGIGWFALALVLLAAFMRRNWFTLTALAVAVVGLVLYSVEPAAPASLLAVLLLARAARREHEGQGHRDDQRAQPDR